MQTKYITYVQNILESYDVIKRILTNRRAGIFFNVQCIVGRAEQAHHTKPLMESGPPTKNLVDWVGGGDNNATRPPYGALL